MSPRALTAAGLAAAAGLGAAALTPWSIATERAVALVDAELARAYGLSLSTTGPVTLVLLPAPRLGFSGAVLRDASGATLAEADSLSAGLGLAALATGRAELSEIAARGARIVLDARTDAAGLARALAGLAAADSRPPDARPSLRRLVLRDATVVRRTASGAETRADAVDLTLSWPRWSATLEAAGGFTWAGSPVRFELAGLRPEDLLAGRESPASLDLRWPAGSLVAEGRLARPPDLSWREARWVGTARLDTRSLRDDLAWLGVPAALGPLVEGLAVEADAQAGGDGVVMPRLRARVAGTTFDGAGAAGYADGRLALSGTLATDALDLGPLLAPVLAGLAGGADGFDLGAATGGDLDLRLSAGRLGAGPTGLEDVAARLVVREGEVEALIGRASLKGGTVKGRIALAAGSRGTEVKLQGAFQRVDVGALLAELGRPRWVQGRAGGQLALETAGATPAALASGVAGRLALGLEDGELSGVSLEDVLRGEPAGRPDGRRPGRTPFERADLALRFVEGVGEITEASLRAPALLAGLRGQVSLPARSLGARAEVAPREGGARPALFDLAGPWSDPSVEPAPAEAAPPFGPAKPWANAPARGRLPAAARAFAP